jgi:hypothetical protein
LSRVVTLIEARHRRHGFHIDPMTAATKWRGETMDYSIAIDALIGRAAQATFPGSARGGT